MNNVGAFTWFTALAYLLIVYSDALDCRQERLDQEVQSVLNIKLFTRSHPMPFIIQIIVEFKTSISSLQ
jgi:hypothetical protein